MQCERFADEQVVDYHEAQRRAIRYVDSVLGGDVGLTGRELRRLMRRYGLDAALLAHRLGITIGEVHAALTVGVRSSLPWIRAITGRWAVAFRGDLS